MPRNLWHKSLSLNHQEPPAGHLTWFREVSGVRILVLGLLPSVKKNEREPVTDEGEHSHFR